MAKSPIAPTAQLGIETVAIRLLIRESESTLDNFDPGHTTGIATASLCYANLLVDGSICADTTSNRLPLRVAIELLSNRVSQLCCFIQDNGLQPPPMQKEKAKALASVLESTGLSKVS
jgi:hypothetical protein